MSNDGYASWKLQFEIQPIILVGGKAQNLPGTQAPILFFIQPELYSAGILGDASLTALDEAFAHFYPLPGATLVDNQIGNYPFANQAVAANAIITQPLKVSMLMICPVREQGGYQSKQATLTGLQGTLAQHNLSGGTYNVNTPSYLYTGCVMTGFRDVTSGEGAQKQIEWQLDFVQPLLTTAEAQAAENSQMQRMTNRTPTPGDPPTATGALAAVGVPSSGAGPSAIPSLQPLVGASVGQFQGGPGATLGTVSATSTSGSATQVQNLGGTVSSACLAVVVASRAAGQSTVAAAAAFPGSQSNSAVLAAAQQLQAAQQLSLYSGSGSAPVYATTSYNLALTLLSAAQAVAELASVSSVSPGALAATAAAYAAAQVVVTSAQNALGALS